MSKEPTRFPDADAADTPQAKAKAAARKAARAAAIAETYTARSDAAVLSDPPAAPNKGAPEGGEAVSEDLKLRDLLEQALEGRELKRSQAKPAIEAALAVLGSALGAGQSVNLPGLGKLTVKRSKVVNGKRVTELRLRQKLDDRAATQRVAEDDEDS